MIREIFQGDWAASLERRAILHPTPFLWSWGVILILALLGVSFLRIDTSTSSFIDRSSPLWPRYLRSVDLFGGDEFLTVVLRDRHPYSHQLVETISELTDQFHGLPGVRRVDSVRTVPLIRSDEAGALELDAAFAAGVPKDASEYKRLVDLLQGDRIASRSLVSADGTAFAINLVLDGDLYRERETLLNTVQEIVGDRPAQISGVPIFRTEINLRTRSEIEILVPATVLLISLVVWVTLRSLIGLLLVNILGGIGVLCALGAMGAVGSTLSLSTMILPSTLLALGCAYSMHPIAAVAKGRGIGGLTATARAVALSGATTALGFLAMSAAGVDAIRDLAVFGAFGVAAITVAVMTLLPALISIIGCDRIESHELGALSRLSSGIVAQFGVKHRRITAALWVLIAAVAGLGLFWLRVETDVIKWFPHGSAVRDHYEQIRSEFSGISPVNVVVRSDGDLSVDDPAAIRTIDGLSSDLESLPTVGKALSVADPLRLVDRALAGDSSGELPASEEQIQQYLLLLEGVPQMRDVLAEDRSAANILVRVDNNSSHEIVELAGWVDQWWAHNGIDGLSPSVTGIMYEFARAEEAISSGQNIGLLLAATMVFAILWAALGSGRLAALALVPNVLPIVVAYGGMGWLGIALDSGTACLGSLAIGIAVDDTVHIVLGIAERSRNGSKNAAAEAVREVGPAIVVTTIAIALGFGLLGISDFTLVRNLGLLTATLVVVCLLADLTLLPALVSSRRLRGVLR